MSALTSALTLIDIQRLSSWKRQYRLEASGFTAEQATHFRFLQWLYQRGRVVR